MKSSSLTFLMKTIVKYLLMVLSIILNKVVLTFTVNLLHA